MGFRWDQEHAIGCCTSSLEEEEERDGDWFLKTSVSHGHEFGDDDEEEDECGKSDASRRRIYRGRRRKVRTHQRMVSELALHALQ